MNLSKITQLESTKADTQIQVCLIESEIFSVILALKELSHIELLNNVHACFSYGL